MADDKTDSPLQGIKDALVFRGELTESTDDGFGRAPTGMGYMDDISYHRLADTLDVPFDSRRDAKMAEKLSFLYDWAKEQTKSSDDVVRREAIRGLQRTLGIQQTGPETIKKMVQWIRLSQTIKRAETQQETIVNKHVDQPQR